MDSPGLDFPSIHESRISQPPFTETELSPAPVLGDRFCWTRSHDERSLAQALGGWLGGGGLFGADSHSGSISARFRAGLVGATGPGPSAPGPAQLSYRPGLSISATFKDASRPLTLNDPGSLLCPESIPTMTTVLCGWIPRATSITRRGSGATIIPHRCQAMATFTFTASTRRQPVPRSKSPIRPTTGWS